MKNLKIGNTDVIIQDFEEGRGKIIIADSYNGAYTYFWGSMGSNISEFICGINKEYFADKLIPGSCYVFSGKRTAKNIRKFIRDDFTYELPWYKFMAGQKELREYIKNIEYMTSDSEFVDFSISLHKRMNCYSLNFKEESEFLDIVESIFACEPWNFIGQETSNSYNWLCSLHKKLVKEIRKQS